MADLRIHRMNLEVLTPTPPPPTLRIHRMNLELLMPFVQMLTKRRPITFLILD